MLRQGNVPRWPPGDAARHMSLQVIAAQGVAARLLEMAARLGIVFASVSQSTWQPFDPEQGATPVADQTLVVVGTPASSNLSPGDWNRPLQNDSSQDDRPERRLP
jgi:hypothetical protein